MQKKFWLLMVLIICLGLTFTACSSNETPNDTTNETDTEEQPSGVTEKTSYTTGGGPQGGAWYGLAGNVASEAEAALPGIKFPVMPGGGIANVILTEKGDMDISTTVSHLYRSAVNGTAPYEGQNAENLSAMMNIGTSDTCLFLVKADLPINSIQELVDQKYPIRIVTTAKSSTPYLGAERILEEYGITLTDIQAWGGSISYLSYTDGCQLISDGHAHGIIAPSVPAITELEQSVPLKLLSIDEEIIDSLVEKYGYSKNLVPAGKYSWNTEDFYCLGEPNILLVRKDVPEDIVYAITKTICEKPEIIKAWGHHHDSFTSELAATGIIGGNLHPGAEKYFKEAGYLK